MHPNDRLYYLDEALKLMEKHHSDQYVIEGLRAIRDEAKREARGA